MRAVHQVRGVQYAVERPARIFKIIQCHHSDVFLRLTFPEIITLNEGDDNRGGALTLSIFYTKAVGFFLDREHVTYYDGLKFSNNSYFQESI